MSKLHVIFGGNSGTGKAVAARCMAGKVKFFMGLYQILHKSLIS